MPCKAKPIAKPTTPAPAKTLVKTLSSSRTPNAIKKPINTMVKNMALAIIIWI